VQADPQRRASFVVHFAIASFYHKSFPALGSASQGVSLSATQNSSLLKNPARKKMSKMGGMVRNKA